MSEEKIISRQQFQNAQSVVEVIVKAKPSAFRNRKPAREKPSKFKRNCPLEKLLEEDESSENDKENRHSGSGKVPKYTNVEIYKKSTSKTTKERRHEILPPNTTYGEFFQQLKEQRLRISDQEESLNEKNHGANQKENTARLPLEPTRVNDDNYSDNLKKVKVSESNYKDPANDAYYSDRNKKIKVSENNYTDPPNDDYYSERNRRVKVSENNYRDHANDDYYSERNKKGQVAENNYRIPLNHPSQFSGIPKSTPVIQKDYVDYGRIPPEQNAVSGQIAGAKQLRYTGTYRENVTMYSSEDPTHSPFGRSALSILRELREKLCSRGDSETVSIIDAFFTGHASAGINSAQTGNFNFTRFPSESTTPGQPVTTADKGHMERLKSLNLQKDGKIKEQEQTINELKNLSEKLLKQHEKFTRSVKFETTKDAAPEKSDEMKSLEQKLRANMKKNEEISEENVRLRDIVFKLEIELAKLRRNKQYSSEPNLSRHENRPLPQAESHAASDGELQIKHIDSHKPNPIKHTSLKQSNQSEQQRIKVRNEPKPKRITSKPGSEADSAFDEQISSRATSKTSHIESLVEQMSQCDNNKSPVKINPDFSNKGYKIDFKQMTRNPSVRPKQMKNTPFSSAESIQRNFQGVQQSIIPAHEIILTKTDDDCSEKEFNKNVSHNSNKKREIGLGHPSSADPTIYRSSSRNTTLNSHTCSRGFDDFPSFSIKSMSDESLKLSDIEMSSKKFNPRLRKIAPESYLSDSQATILAAGSRNLESTHIREREEDATNRRSYSPQKSEIENSRHHIYPEKTLSSDQ